MVLKNQIPVTVNNDFSALFTVAYITSSLVSIVISLHEITALNTLEFYCLFLHYHNLIY